jgi:hypothetical protein
MTHELIIFATFQCGFFLGFVLGRVTKGVSSGTQEDSKVRFGGRNETMTKMKILKIDEARYVTKVADDKFVKTGNELGKTSAVDDDIGSSVSKLAQLKQRK